MNPCRNRPATPFQPYGDLASGNTGLAQREQEPVFPGRPASAAVGHGPAVTDGFADVAHGRDLADAHGGLAEEDREVVEMVPEDSRVADPASLIALDLV